MKGKLYIFSAIFLLFAGCNSPNEPGNTNQLVVQNFATLNSDPVSVSQVNYTSILIKNTDSLVVNSQYVNTIYIGKVVNNTFINSDTLTPTYSSSDNHRFLMFSYTLEVADSLTNIEVFAQFNLDNNTSILVRKKLDLLTFLYGNTKILLKWNEFYPDWELQDFSLNDNYIYYHKMGPMGVFEYDRRTNNSRMLIELPGGDYVDSNTKYVIIDNQHHYIDRYNISNDKIDLQNSIENLTGLTLSNQIFIAGMGSTENNFYVTYDQGHKLLILNDSLQLVSSLNLDRKFYYLKVYNNIIYGLDYSNYSIVRYDLATNQFLADRPFPSNDVTGFKIYKDVFYFSDFNKKIIGYLPIDDIINYSGKILKPLFSKNKLNRDKE